MRRSICRVLICLCVSGVATTTSAIAEQLVPPPQAPVTTAQPAAPADTSESRAQTERVPVRIELSLSRHQGDKRISNLPFTLLATVGDPTRLRIGSNVPVGVASVTYQSIGTNIDATVRPAGAGRYRLELQLQDSSVAEPPAPGQQGAASAQHPVIRSNSLNTSLLLRDGQTTELVVASDKVSGETIKAEVRVTEIK